MVNITTNNFTKINTIAGLPLDQPDKKFHVKTFIDGCGACEASFKDVQNDLCNLMEKKGNKCFGIDGRDKKAQKLMAQLGEKPLFPQDLFCETKREKDEKTGLYKMSCYHSEGYAPKEYIMEGAKKLGFI